MTTSLPPPPAPAIVPSSAPLGDSPLVSLPPLPAQLLIAQAVNQLGTKSWQEVSKLVDSSEEWPTEAGKLTPQGLENVFYDMMKNRGLDPAACKEPKSRPTRKLIYQLYSQLLNSLRDSLLASHDETMKLRQEIEVIEGGKLDDKLVEGAPGVVRDKFEETERVRMVEEEEKEKEKGRREEKGKGKAVEEGAELGVVEEEGEGDGKRPRTPSTRRSGRNSGKNEGEGGEEVEMKEGGTPTKGGRGDGDDLKSDPAVEGSSGTSTKEKEKKDKKGKKSGKREKKKSKKGGEVAAVEEAEDEDEAEGEGEEKVEGGEAEEEEEGEGENEEETVEEEEESTKRSGRRKGSAAANKKAARSNKRKASEPPTASNPDSPAQLPTEGEGVPPTEGGEGESSEPANKKAKRGKKSKTEPEDESGSKALQLRRKAAFGRIVETIRALPYSNSFESRITKSIAPNYASAVRRPMCLKDINKRIKSGEIKEATDLMRDFAILCANAVQFNGDEGEGSVGRQAKDMWSVFESTMNDVLSTEFNVENS